MSYVYKSEAGFISKEDRDDSREDLLTEPREVVDEEGELGDTDDEQQ